MSFLTRRKRYRWTAHSLASPYDLICAWEFAVHADSVLCACKPPLGNSSDVTRQETAAVKHDALAKACGGGNCSQMGTGSVPCRSDLPDGIHFSPCTKLYLKLIFKRKFYSVVFHYQLSSKLLVKIKNVAGIKTISRIFSLPNFAKASKCCL